MSSSFLFTISRDGPSHRFDLLSGFLDTNISLAVTPFQKHYDLPSSPLPVPSSSKSSTDASTPSLRTPRPHATHSHGPPAHRPHGPSPSPVTHPRPPSTIQKTTILHTSPHPPRFPPSPPPHPSVTLATAKPTGQTAAADIVPAGTDVSTELSHRWRGPGALTKVAAPRGPAKEAPLVL